MITQIKASITAGIRPCAMIFHEQPTASWNKYDFMLLEAYQMLQDEICPKCGHPVWLCRSNSQNVEFKVNGAVCQAERALKEYEDQKKPRGQRAEKAERRTWGLFHYTSPFTPENIDGDLPTRDEYYQEMADSVEGNDDGTVN